MAKVTLTDIAAGYLSIATYNANNTAIEAAIENTLSRDGTAPNTMGANLDLNSNKIVNVTDGTNNQDAVTLAQLNAVVAGQGASTTATLVSIADAGGYYTSTTVEAALQEAYVDWVAGDAAVTAAFGAADTTIVSNLASNANALGASLVGVEDAAGNWTATDVEATLVEMQAEIDAGGGTLSNVVEDTTPQLGGDLDANTKNINMGSYSIRDPLLVNYRVAVESGSINAGVCTIDLDDGNVVTVTLSQNITSFTIVNKPLTNYFEILIKFVQDITGFRTVTWGGDLAGIKWADGGVPPVITTTPLTGTDLISLKNFDANQTEYFGNFSQNYT